MARKITASEGALHDARPLDLAEPSHGGFLDSVALRNWWTTRLSEGCRWKIGPVSSAPSRPPRSAAHQVTAPTQFGVCSWVLPFPRAPPAGRSGPTFEPWFPAAPRFPIYLDYSATSPCDERVVDAGPLAAATTSAIPASRSRLGLKPKLCRKGRRARRGRPDWCRPARIVWTSGATESTTLAIKGAATLPIAGKHIITVKTEHKAVLDTFRELEHKALGHLPRRAGWWPAQPGCVQGRHPSPTPSW